MSPTKKRAPKSPLNKQSSFLTLSFYTPGPEEGGVGELGELGLVPGDDGLLFGVVEFGLEFGSEFGLVPFGVVPFGLVPFGVVPLGVVVPGFV